MWTYSTFIWSACTVQVSYGIYKTIHYRKVTISYDEFIPWIIWYLISCMLMTCLHKEPRHQQSLCWPFALFPSNSPVAALESINKQHDDVIKWKHFQRYWPFVRGIHRSPVNSLHKGQWRGALMFSLICVWINGWVNTREAGDLRLYRSHCDVIVMKQAHQEIHSPLMHHILKVKLGTLFVVYTRALYFFL